MGAFNTVATLPGTASQTTTAAQDWDDPNAIKAQDGGMCYTSNPATSINSEKLIGSNFGFTIPTNATIVGIGAVIRKYQSNGAQAMYDISVKLMKAGSDVGSNYGILTPTKWPSTITDVAYGGETDLWGTTWTPAEINNSGFGLGLVMFRYGASGDPYVDSFKITVYYTLPDNGNILYF